MNIQCWHCKLLIFHLDFWQDENAKIYAEVFHISFFQEPLGKQGNKNLGIIIIYLFIYLFHSSLTWGIHSMH